MTFAKVLLVASLIGISLREAHSHGMMMDPVQRSSAWRRGFPVDPNYTDNQLFCGGLTVQFEQNGGKCGECGDDYALPRPRPNENGGIYGTDLIVKKYKRGETININVKLTANHLGTFTFHLCPLTRSNELETEDCFNRNPIQLADGSYTMDVPSGKMEYNVAARLPENVTCEHCVLRWNYRSGNNWGECDDGHSALGCGPQETFRNCADIAIL
ncbi:uncharacterized protein LOC128879431 [Hylaeus volcanicus]|uniref:uncharacterized protein LOC128879431 n=1 Tax=Hylaeus volcanicus TaxID=313075 RepID=UPI0023B7DBE2|nr:uncharacterized protein LOC128879431 [Hylaeus volcanicus]